MKIYIAGPITGNPHYVEQFEYAEKRLVAAGHAVVNPTKNDGFSYKEYIDMGLCELMRCDTIFCFLVGRHQMGRISNTTMQSQLA